MVPLFFFSWNSFFVISCSEDLEGISNESKESSQNKFCITSGYVLACAAHPINGTVIAGAEVRFYPS